jgi:hypothetical protein
MAILVTVTTLFLSVGTLYLFIIWARCYATDLNHASKHFDVAYEAAQKLIKNPKTTESVLTFIPLFLAQGGRPHLARRFALHLISGGLSKMPSSDSARRFSSDLERMDGEQKKAFNDLIVSGMISSAAADPIFSRLYLKAIQMFLSASGRGDDKPSSERTETVAVDFASRELACA